MTDENAEEEEENSDEAMETESQRFQCYAQSEMCEVSDPETWMEIHHGVSEDGACSDDEET